MKKTILFLLGSLGVASGGMAQHLSPNVIAVSGGTARTPTMTLEWTLGESVIESAATSNRLYTQGFHQPILQVSESETGSDANYTFTVAPNPVASYLNISIKAPESTPLQLVLTDLNGHQYNYPLVPAGTKSTQIDMTQFPAGMYLLRISKAEGAFLKSYKVVKDQ